MRLETVRIAKGQTDIDQCRSRVFYYNSAREGFGDLLSSLTRQGSYVLLLPAYIGLSPKEGSGIYDPVVANNVSHVFYRMDRNLHVDVEALRTQMDAIKEQKVLLLVHYWGYVDPNYDAIAEMAKKQGCILIEDMAHAFFTEYVNYACGKECDASFYSLHKMFPFSRGGMLKIRENGLGKEIVQRELDVHFPAEYDFRTISERRKRNAMLWEKLVEQEREEFGILRPCEVYRENTPQTYPIRILKRDRFRVYRELNDAGFGAISLYHTMIPPIRAQNYPDSMKLSSEILNLPVHQDVKQSDIRDMFELLMSVCKSGC